MLTRTKPSRHKQAKRILRVLMTYDTIRYDTIEKFNGDSKAQLNLAHVDRKKYTKEETKANKRQCPFNLVQVNLCLLSL